MTAKAPEADIVLRLRNGPYSIGRESGQIYEMIEAADEITRLRAELDAAVKLLECWKVWSCGQNGQSPFFETKEWLSSISHID